MYPYGTSPSPLHSSSFNCLIHVNATPYAVIHLLGEGLHSRVYAAYDSRTGQSVAIKVVQNLESAADSSEHLRMFFKEIDYLTKLQSRNPYVIRVYNHEFDYQTQTGKIVMESGHDFRGLLPLQASRREKQMNNAQTKYYWKQMVEAVALLHRHGIVHSGRSFAVLILLSMMRVPSRHQTGELHHDEKRSSSNHRSRPFVSSIAHANIRSASFRRHTGVHAAGSMSNPERPLLPSRPGIGHLVVRCVVVSPDRRRLLLLVGVLLFEMTFGYRPFEHVPNSYKKMSHIARLTHDPVIPPTSNPYLRDVLEQCLQINPHARPTAEHLLKHSFFLR